MDLRWPLGGCVAVAVAAQLFVYGGWWSRLLLALLTLTLPSPLPSPSAPPARGHSPLAARGGLVAGLLGQESGREVRGPKANAEACDGACTVDAEEVARQKAEAWWAALDPEQREVEEDWQRQLTPLQFRVLRQRQTEDAGSGEHTYTAAAGRYSCAGCGLQLYDSKHKFTPEASVHGWPAFFDNIEGRVLQEANSKKPELTCSRCGGHLGHVFKSSRYPGPKHQRHCVNSASLVFTAQSQPAD